MEQVQGQRDITAEMHDATISFLALVRSSGRKARAIRSVNDAIELSINEPSLDKEIAEALKVSGYLDCWRMEKEDHPWRYDVAQMVALGNDPRRVVALRAYCEESLRADKNGTFQHCAQALQELGRASLTHRRQTLVLLRDLYSDLLRLHVERTTTARTWLTWRESSFKS